MATKSSDVMMSIRLPKELRDSFAKVCEDRNQTASKVIKSFMEDYVKKAKDGDGKQSDRKKESSAFIDTMRTSKGGLV